jgi:RHS repeat-associated protein
LGNVTAFGYNTHGNLTSTTNALGFVSSVEYDSAGLPLVLTDARGYSTTNQYDAAGNLVAVINANNSTNRFVYDTMGRVTEQIDALNRTNRIIYDGNDNRRHLVNALGATNSFTYDANNNRTSSTDALGAVTTNIYAFDSFGVLANSEGDCPQPFRYLGRHGIIDDGTGLYHARARYFNPQLGRFLSKDPVTGKDSDSQSLNRYVYALNSPLTLVDISGLCSSGGSPGFWNTMGNAAYQSVLMVGNVAIGVVEGVAEGISSIILFPEFLVYATANPQPAAQAIWSGVRADWNALASGDPRQIGQLVGAFAGPSLALKGLGVAGRATSESGGLFHYTTESGLRGILESGGLKPSLKALNPSDARYGSGQYLSDIVPGTKTPAQLSREFLGQPFQGQRFTHFLEIDVSGLNTVQGRPGVFVIPGETPLDLTGRIIRSGSQ